MKIRRLEIQGFKSFADRTVLKFGDGVTGVVGPNGCGKSNIVDAIRWVMGEQSAKHLRGLGMQDVIFAGCETRGSAGMAEVTITFENDGDLVPPEYQQHREIQVTRRLFRDGTSEYAINQVACRLRDILDLFMGTGIGKNAYAIIEQGRIGMIVTARPEERRALIEDAAGVSRYKARRKQAERRIAATEQNLLRVNDLVSELGARLSSLAEQAEKARRYQSLKAELKALDLHAAAHQHLESVALEGHRLREAAELEGSTAREAEALTDGETRVRERLEALAAEETDLRTAEEAAHAQRRALELKKQNVEFLVREDAKLEERVAEAEVEREALTDERARLRAEREELEAMASSLDEGGDEEQRRLQAREAALGHQTEQVAAARARLDADRQRASELGTRIAERRSAVDNAGRLVEDLSARVEAARHEGEGARKRAAELDRRVGQLEKDLGARRQLELRLEEETESRRSDLEAARAEARTLDDRLSEVRDELVDRRSRLRNLEKIRANYENCSDAVKAVMGREAQEGLHGLVADVLSADARYETAVEAVLGERLQSVVVSELTDGHEAARFLRAEGAGRSTFVPVDVRLDHAPWAPRAWPVGPERVSTKPPAGRPAEVDAPSRILSADEDDAGMTTALPAPLSEPPSPADAAPSTAPPGADPSAGALTRAPAAELPDGPSPSAFGEAVDWWETEDGEWPDLSHPEVCGRMVDLVRTKPGYETVAQALLGDVVVVESFERAHQLWVDNGHRKTLVTLEGDVLDPMGLFTGGSSAGVSDGLLAQKREMEELRREVRQLEAKLAAAESKKKELADRIDRIASRLEALSTEAQQGALSILGLERDVGAHRERADRERQLAEAADATALELRTELERVRAEKTATEEARAALETEREALEAQAGTAAADLAELEREAQRIADEVTMLKVGVAANRERQDSSRASLTRIRGRLEDIARRLATLDATVERASEERRTIADRAAEERAEIAHLDVAVEEEAGRLGAVRTRLEAERAAIRTLEAEHRERREALEALRARHAELTMAIRELRLSRENLHAKVEERYRVDLGELLTDYHALPPQSPEHVELTRKLRRQLDQIGAINLTAIEEHAVVAERHGHLARQKEDLERALEALRGAIERINLTSQDRFVEAFRLVNEKFQQVFPKVFAGGRCALVMTHEDDPLESGIEIMAQPPGKKLQSVNLLSGGEKALTAVSLIFGIFLIKPTPFCLLDEVDAPLDEANVGRYNEMLQEMSGISQFILITHNKRTMELPDRLYGVTMEVPGVSKIVPVDVVAPEKKPHLEAV